MADQPERIRIPLKPHQRAALHKAILMEQYGTVRYQNHEELHMTHPRGPYILHGPVTIKTNVGVLGDVVGYGKTLTALSIVASTPCHEIYRENTSIHSYNGRHNGLFTAICERPERTHANAMIHSTLVVVPRGPVFVQWENAIRTQTNLRVLALDSLPTIRKYCPFTCDISIIKQTFEQYDIVLLKNTSLKTFMDYYREAAIVQHMYDNPIVGWDRIMIDEAHELLSKVPLFDYRYLWLISGTFEHIMRNLYSSRNFMSYALRDIVCDEHIYFMLLRGDQEFVARSFSVPPLQEHYYLCKLPTHLMAIQPFVHQHVLERLNANDVEGAIRELGGKSETENDIVELVTRDLMKDIHNKERERQYVESLEIAHDQKEYRMNHIQMELQRLQDRMQSLRDRVSQLNEKTCAICYDNIHNPMMLPCTHVFCGQCIVQWMKNGHVCPECRQPACPQGLIAIVNQKGSGEGPSAPTIPQFYSKEDTLMHILRQKPQGKFLVFSRVDSTFFGIRERLVNEGISHAEIKGSTSQMMNILQRFRDGQLQVILLNTYHAGSGIDISFATDVIIFHNMGLDKVQAVGRAQRVGRVDPLAVHNLCYPHEMNAQENINAMT